MKGQGKGLQCIEMFLSKHKLEIMLYHVDYSDEDVRKKIRSGDVRLAGNRRLKIYDSLHCWSGKRMLRKNRVFFGSEEEAVAAGYRPCKHCKCRMSNFNIQSRSVPYNPSRLDIENSTFLYCQTEYPSKQSAAHHDPGGIDFKTQYQQRRKHGDDPGAPAYERIHAQLNRTATSAPRLKR